jgi:uncharacterized protein (DUF2235 family)
VEIAKPIQHNESRNIVICCDGTGNEFGIENSNVVKLYQSLIIDAGQIGYYHPGVGTMGAPNAQGRIEKALTRFKGLAFGSGLMDNVGDAYRYLMNSYREGDKIFLFGFSRGAYTARVLAGVLHVCGLLCPGNEGLIPYVIQLFARKSRRREIPTVSVAEHFKATFSRDVLVHFAGVWDTVSSVGWIYDPVVLPDEGRNPIIRTGRHAVSIDERRCYYQDKLWGRPYQPNEPEFRTLQDIKQVWFAGVHSDVGGSYPEPSSGLSKLALEWMLHEASQFGLKLDPLRAAMVLGRSADPAAPSSYATPNPCATLHNSLHGTWWCLEFLPHRDSDPKKRGAKYHVPLGTPRKIPQGSLVHESVLQRMEFVKAYRPKNLPASYTLEPRIIFPDPQMLKGN